MSGSNFSRRQFLQSAFYSGLIYGTGALPNLISTVSAAPASLQNKTLIDLFLDGGPDFRHLIVPEYDATSGSFGQKYWSNRTRSHSLNASGQTAQQRWNDDYFHITVGNTPNNWSTEMDSAGTLGALVDSGSLNSGVTFGIWKEAGWLIDMFRAGNVALIFNAVGGTNRAHDLSTLMLHQGNVLSGLNNADRSGWGGRLARSAGGNSISLTNTPSPFCFGPFGSAPNYDPNAIDNVDLLSIENSRNIGLFDFDFDTTQQYNRYHKMARAAKSYYAGLRQEQLATVYDKFMDHESKVREFGLLIGERLETVPVPYLIEALYDGVNDLNGMPINPEPDVNSEDFGEARRVLRNSYSFGSQIRNLYDILAVSDVEQLDPRVMSMIYGGWDSHGDQREVPSVLANDPNNPYVSRGIENGLRDIFGGQFDVGVTPLNSAALHCGFSALWASLPIQSDRDKLVVTIAGEFGRQIRDNGDAGTDHGRGNLMLVISELCQGGIYGEIFPQSELAKYDEPTNYTPDIEPLTEFDHFFSKVCDWVAPNSGSTVFPRMSAGYGGTQPIIETGVSFDNLFS